MPERRIGTEQQETGTLKRESHILRGRVQRTGHASRPQEGPRNHRDDSAHGQATASIFPRYGQLHGDIHSKPLTSHRTTTSDASKRQRVSLGRSTNTVLSASQDLNC